MNSAEGIFEAVQCPGETHSSQETKEYESANQDRTLNE
jgi:hypothetical protein